MRDYVVAGSTGSCTLIGAEQTASAEGAALANAVAGHGMELDDVHLPSFNHPGAAAVPAGLAVAELVGATGEELITAIALGYEVMCRVGRGLAPSYVTDRGFHPQGVVGPLGAAVTAAVLLGLDARAIEQAMSLSVSHAGGTLQYLESASDTPQLHVGLGAMGGVRSALLAKAGLRGPDESIEGRYGLANAFAESFDLSLMTDDLGSVYSLMFNTFKVRPHHVLVHAAIDATVEALPADVRAEDIERIVLCATSRMSRFAGSLELAVAEAITDGATTDLATRVVLTQDDECEQEYDGGGHRGPKIKVKAEIALRDGRALRAETYAKGSYENPLSPRELDDKFQSLLARSPLATRSETLSDLVLNLEKVASVRDLTTLLTGISSAAADA